MRPEQPEARRVTPGIASGTHAVGTRAGAPTRSARRRRRTALLAVALSFAAARAIAQTSAPPAAPARAVADTLFDTVVVDLYRWMETPGSPELAAWMRAQNDYARAALRRLPGRARLLERIKSLDDADTVVTGVQEWGGRYFYLKLEPGADVPRLYTRQGLAGPERLLVDPARARTDSAPAGVHSAIDYFYPSPDGRYVVYGISPGGSEASVIRVVESATGRDLGERIDRAQFATVSWRMDGRSFFFNRLQKLGPGAPPTEKYKRGRNYLHVLGTDPERDTPVFGYGLSPRVAAGEDDFPVVLVSPASPYAVGILLHGVQNEVALYVARADSTAGPSTPWRKLADTSDAVTAVDVHGDAAYLLTHRDALRYKVLRASLAHPDLAHAAVVVPPSRAVVTGIAAAGDALYVQTLDGGIGRLARVAYDGATPRPIALPFAGSIPALVTNPTRPGALVRLTSWTQSPRWYRYDPSAGQLGDTRLEPPSAADYADIVSEEVMVRSADGTMVPLSIIHKRGLALDGSHPTWLTGYGAYGITLDPNFRPTRLPWLERGGVRAVAHVRGGGEFGEEWHLAGKQRTKQHTIDDFLACAQYLIDHGYTSTAHLAAEGGSAGGITAGGAITQRPDLFAAALIEVGAFNTLRSELSPSGPANVPEFGSVTTRDGFRALLAMDAYQHVRPGTRYPAVLLTTGVNDPRVEPWEVAKMAARLQASTTSGKPVLLRVEYEAGHGFGTTKSQRDEELADEMAFLLSQLGAPEAHATP